MSKSIEMVDKNGDNPIQVPDVNVETMKARGWIVKTEIQGENDLNNEKTEGLEDGES